MEHTSATTGEGRAVDRTRERVLNKYADARRLEALMVAAAHASARQLIAAATQVVVDLLGERGSCVLVDSGPHVVLATHAPGLNNLPVDLARYPEIRAALDSGAVVAIEDARVDPLLTSVRELLPRRLGAVAVVPLIVGEHRLGVIMAQSTSRRSMTPEAVTTAALVGRFTALLLEARLGKRVELVFTGTHEFFGDAGQVPLMITAPDGSTRKRVLIIEDDAEHTGALAAALRHGGYDVDIVANGADGLRRAQERRPDAILLAVCLPGLDGISVAERLREDARTHAVPILFLSSVDELLPRARHATFERVDYLPRTESLPDLLARIDSSIRG